MRKLSIFVTAALAFCSCHRQDVYADTELDNQEDAALNDIEQNAQELRGLEVIVETPSAMSRAATGEAATVR